MAQTVGGFVTSHAMAFVEPERWEGMRTMLHGAWENHFDAPPPPEPVEVLQETEADARSRFQNIVAVHDLIASRIRELKPDLLIVFGNDQDENYGHHAVPQFAFYTGSEVLMQDRVSQTTQRYRCDRHLALDLMEHVLESGFDVMQTTEFEDGALLAHAFTQLAHRFDPQGEVAVLPIFVNAASPPYTSPRRCFDFGRTVRSAIAAFAPERRVMLCASGGLSHFTLAQFAMAGYRGPQVMGSICADFDHELIEAIRTGDLERTARYSTDDLVEQGDGEFRQALALLGALPDGATPEILAYEPLYRAMTGIWAGYWDFTPQPVS